MHWYLKKYLVFTGRPDIVELILKEMDIFAKEKKDIDIPQMFV